ncbi:MAG: hypothetical protein PHQ34_12145 [Methanothrix sp.]|nr:hypothetical protein [Methanothrix sp.]
MGKSALIFLLNAPKPPGNLGYNIRPGSDFCYRARQACPIISTKMQKSGKSGCKSFRARVVIYRSFAGPVQATGSDEAQHKAFRRVRDEIKKWIVKTFE